MNTSALIATLSLVMCTGLAAQQPAPPPGNPRTVEGQRLDEMRYVEGRRLESSDPLERFLFSPELIMRRQRGIGLQPAQRTQITQIIGRLEASLVEFQWTMQEQQQQLAELLQQPQVNADAALQALDRVLATETSIKRAHFQSLLQIRNVLTPEQQHQLRGGPPRGAPGREDER